MNSSHYDFCSTDIIEEQTHLHVRTVKFVLPQDCSIEKDTISCFSSSLIAHNSVISLFPDRISKMSHGF